MLRTKNITRLDLTTFILLVLVSLFGLFTYKPVASKIFFGCLLGLALVNAFVKHRMWRMAALIALTAVEMALIVYYGINRIGA